MYNIRPGAIAPVWHLVYNVSLLSTCLQAICDLDVAFENIVSQPHAELENLAKLLDLTDQARIILPQSCAAVGHEVWTGGPGTLILGFECMNSNALSGGCLLSAWVHPFAISLARGTWRRVRSRACWGTVSCGQLSQAAPKP